jgi:hypothetical protein
MSFPRHEESINPMGNKKPGAASVPTPGAHRLDEFQPVIPWRVALPQSPPPLHRPASECDKVVSPVENFAANGEHGLNCLSQPRGQPQYPPLHCRNTGAIERFVAIA